MPKTTTGRIQKGKGKQRRAPVCADSIETKSFLSRRRGKRLKRIRGG